MTTLFSRATEKGFIMEQTKVIYIAGYGRSGSTVLDIILGNHPEIASSGEATKLLDHVVSGARRQCACGESYRECGFWQDFIDPSLTPELSDTIRKIERLSSIPRLLLGLIAPRDRQVYLAYQNKLFNYIISKSGKSIVVDSSKSTWDTVGRFLALSKLAGYNVYVVHLIRDGLATMESEVITGSNLELEGYGPATKWPWLRVPLGWVRTNVWTALLGRSQLPERYTLIRYEDFIIDPAKCLRDIGRWCGIDVEGLIECIDNDESFQVGHLYGGNRVRLQGRVKIRGEVKQKYGDRLKPYHRLYFTIVGGWLQHYYGYDNNLHW